MTGAIAKAAGSQACTNMRRRDVRWLNRWMLTTASTAALSVMTVATIGTLSLPRAAYAAECDAGGSANGGDDNGEATNTACGQDAVANGAQRATAIGVSSKASGTGSTAIGAEAEATALGATASGFLAKANGINSSAYGLSATASGLASSAFGAGAEAGSEFSSAFGIQAKATGRRSTAVGNNASASGTFSSAFGDYANASGVSSTAVGTGSSAEAKGSAAFGAGAVATRENQQAFGTAENTYTMAGINTAASRAAQAGPTSIVTSDASGNLAARSAAELGLASIGDITSLQSQINHLEQRDDELADGIAISMALSQPFFHNNQRFALNLGWGNFEGSNALGVTAAGIVDRGTFGPTSTTTIYGGAGVGVREGTVGGRAGLTFGW